jgi:hypothetical protein
VSLRLLPWAGALALTLGSAAGGVTPKQAQTLPVAELARLVLGEAGALVVDVDRPKWPTCEIMCPPLTEEQLKQPPPLRLGLTFYLRPFAASGMLNKWTGLCGVSHVFVSYGEHDELTGIGTGQRWGVPHGMERVTATAASQDFTTRLAAETEKCRTGADSRAFFVADGYDTSAYRVVIAAQLFAEAARRNAPLPFKFACKSYLGRCEDGGAETVAARFRPANISQVWQVDCAEPHHSLSSNGPNGCYDVMLKGEGENLLVEVADAHSQLKIKRVEYSHGMVVY